MSVLLVMLGGALGAGARYLVGEAMLGWLGRGLPWGTLTVNVAGGLLTGLFVAWLGRHPAPEPWRLFLGVGMLGGFTTFSAFSLEMVTMAENGQPTLAVAYAALSVGAAVAALIAGVTLARAAT